MFIIRKVENELQVKRRTILNGDGKYKLAKNIMIFYSRRNTHVVKGGNIINSNEICNKDKIKTITFIESYASLF